MTAPAGPAGPAGLANRPSSRRAQRGVRYDIGAHPRPPEWPSMDEPPEPVPSRAPVQVTVLATGLVALVAVGLATEDIPGVIGCGLALGAGVGVGLSVDLTAYFRRVSGMLVAVAVFALLVLGSAMAGADRLELWLGPILMAAVFIVGLDWRRTDRLRSLVWVSGLLVVGSLGVGDSWTWLVAVLWLSLALGSLWLIEQDRLAARPRPDSPGGGATEEPRLRASDLVRAGLIALGVGLVTALLIGTPSCERVGSGLASLGGLDPNETYGGPGEGDGATGSAGADGGIGSIPTSQPQGSTEPSLVDPDSGPSSVPSSGQTPDRGSGGELGGESGRGSGSQPGNEPGSDFGDGEDPGVGARPVPSPEPGVSWWLVGALFAVVVAAIGVVVWLLTQSDEDGVESSGPSPSPWALETTARVEAAGAAVGRPRLSGETILGYTAALSAPPIADDRLVGVGRLISAALFGRTEPSDEERAWVASVLTDIERPLVPG